MVDAPKKDEKAENKTDKQVDTDKKEAPAPKPQTVQQDVKACYALLQQATTLFEPRLTLRVLRTLPSIRKRLNVGNLHEIIDGVYPQASEQKQLLLSLLPDAPPKDTAMEIDDSSNPAQAKPSSTPKPTTITPEADIFTTLLVIVFLLDQKMIEAGIALSDRTIQRLQTINKRSIDQLAGRVYFYYARFHELNNDLPAIRPVLLLAQKTASLRNDQDTLATVLNLILRTYYAQNQYDQADKLIAKVKFPGAEASASNANLTNNAQLARWCYYVGRLRAIQLQYTEAYTMIQQAIRRAPQAAVAPGFYQAAHKLSIVIELLMGDIPDRRLFRQPVLRISLSPYLTIVQAVRVGDLQGFTSAVTTHHKQFKSDGTHTLIARLRVNVIKTALRTISLAYSRIPLSVVCTKLGLDSEEEAEYIVAKAIKDGVVEAGLDHEKGIMMSSEMTDVYATSEPLRAFDERIKFCLNLRNESVKAMRYPMQAHKKELANAGEARERERELAQDILDGRADDDDDDLL